MNLSVIIPAFNEKDRITVTLDSLREYFTRKDYSSYEILVVDDGSRDGTADLVRSYAKDFPAIKVIENGVNRGKGYSVCNGMMHARGNYRLFMDADNSVSITNLDEFLRWVKDGYDVVIGSIKVGNASATEHAGLSHTTGSSLILNLFSHAITKISISKPKRSMVCRGNISRAASAVNNLKPR